MKIALYAGMFRRDQDGATKTLYRLVEGLRQQGHRLAVWAFTHDERPPRDISCHTVPSIPLPIYREYRIGRFDRVNKRRLEEFDPDIVHISVPDLVGLAMLRWAYSRRIPVLSTFHTDFPAYLKFYGLGLLRRPLWDYFRWFYNRCDTVLAPTDIVIETLRAQGIKPLQRLQRGIDTIRFSPGYRSQKRRRERGVHDGQSIILYVGRLVWYKGLETFCHVYRRFQDEPSRPPPLFRLVGNGPILDELKKRMPKAVFPGHLTGGDLARAYADADLFLFPSETETLGNVILEALASGLPVIVSDRGGCREITTVSGGGLIACGADPDHAYALCRQLLEDPELRHRCRKNGLEYTRNRSWDSIVAQLIEQYREIIRQKEAASPTLFRPRLGNPQRRGIG